MPVFALFLLYRKVYKARKPFGQDCTVVEEEFSE